MGPLVEWVLTNGLAGIVVGLLAIMGFAAWHIWRDTLKERDRRYEELRQECERRYEELRQEHDFWRDIALKAINAGEAVLRKHGDTDGTT